LDDLDIRLDKQKSAIAFQLRKVIKK